MRSDAVKKALARARGSSDLLEDPFTAAPNAFKPMMLSTLGPDDDLRIAKRIAALRVDVEKTTKDPLRYGALSTRDIANAAPKPLYKYTNRDGSASQGYLVKQFAGETGMHPKVLIPRQTNRPDRTLRTDDIEGTKSRPKDIIRRPRGTNPLAPEYHLPRYVEEKCEAPHFVRNTMDISDIEGAKSGKLFEARPNLSKNAEEASLWENRSLTNRDIERSRPFSSERGRIYQRKTRTILNVDDINMKKVPYVRKMSREEYMYEDIEGSKPRQLSAHARLGGGRRKIDFSLNNDDVEGARPVSRISTNEYRSTNYVQDIVGAPKPPTLNATTPPNASGSGKEEEGNNAEISPPSAPSSLSPPPPVSEQPPLSGDEKTIQTEDGGERGEDGGGGGRGEEEGEKSPVIPISASSSSTTQVKEARRKKEEFISSSPSPPPLPRPPTTSFTDALGGENGEDVTHKWKPSRSIKSARGGGGGGGRGREERRGRRAISGRAKAKTGKTVRIDKEFLKGRPVSAGAVLQKSPSSSSSSSSSSRLSMTMKIKREQQQLEADIDCVRNLL